MTELPYWVIYFGIAAFSFLTVFLILKARRRNEPAYYWSSGTCFLLLLAFVAFLFSQILLFIALFGLALVISFAWLPQIKELNREELVKQKQETDVSAPLRLRDVLTMKAWIKINATHGFRTAIALYILTSTGILAAVVLVLIAINLTSLRFAFYLIVCTIVSLALNYRQAWKVLKEPRRN